MPPSSSTPSRIKQNATPQRRQNESRTNDNRYGIDVLALPPEANSDETSRFIFVAGLRWERHGGLNDLRAGRVTFLIGSAEDIVPPDGVNAEAFFGIAEVMQHVQPLHLLGEIGFRLAVMRPVMDPVVNPVAHHEAREHRPGETRAEEQAYDRQRDQHARYRQERRHH